MLHSLGERSCEPGTSQPRSLQRGGRISQRPGQMSAFLPPEWRGHVCAFIRLTPGQKITTGGRAPSGAPKTCPVSKDSDAGPVPVRPSVCMEAAQPYTGSGRPGEKVRENGVSRELGDVPCPQGPERPRPRVWSASEVAQASVASSGCPLWPAGPGGRAVPSAPGGEHLERSPAAAVGRLSALSADAQGKPRNRAWFWRKSSSGAQTGRLREVTPSQVFPGSPT